MVLDDVATLCSDFGTESTLKSAIPSDTDLRDVLPWVQCIGGDDGTGVGTPKQPPWWGVAPLLRSALQRAVLIPGINHIAHNISGMIADKLQDYKPWFLPRLKAVAYVLSHSHYNDRFRRTCLQAPEARSLHPVVKAGVPEVIEWRWGSIVETAHAIDGLRCAMMYWSWPKFNFKAADDTDEEDIPELDHADEGGAEDNKELKKKKSLVDGPLISDAVSSKYYWAYQTMVLYSEDVMLAVRAFGLSCPCHKMEATSKYMRLAVVYTPFLPCM